MVKDFPGVFKNISESIYLSFENDPYSSSSQPYVGNVTVNISIDEDLKVENSHELFLLLTTESLFEGLKYEKERLKYIFRYVYLPVNTKKYTFNNVHPGTYYLYSYNDLNNDKRVNLIDFSITAYWYKRPSPPATVDLNNDGKVNLVDFSIMAYYWTG